MNKPKNHHYIPETYLKSFSNHQKQLYQFRKDYKKFRLVSIAQICYEPNYFKINDTDLLKIFKIDDPNYIEKEYFKKQENNFQSLLKKLVQPGFNHFEISLSEISLFLETILTIKKRNPFHKSRIISAYKEYIKSEKFEEDSKLGVEISRQVDNFNPEIFIEKYIEEIQSSKEKQSDFFLQFFLDKSENRTNLWTNLLLEFKIFILHAPAYKPFITTDNPGFTKLPNGEGLPFGGFGLDFEFFFPLTPQCCLCINKNQKDENGKLIISKKIFRKNVDADVVNMINTYSFFLSEKKVFSYTKESIESVARNLIN